MVNPNIITNSAGILPSNQLLDADAFPTITGTLYAWNDFVQGTLANADWTGSKDLSCPATVAYTTDHLGRSNNAVLVDGSTNPVLNSDAVFDTTNESFSVGGWFRLDQFTNSECLCSKMKAGDPDDYSWQLWHYPSSNIVKFFVYYVSGSYTNLVQVDNSIFKDGLYHHVVAIYDQSVKSVAIYVDGKCLAYKIDSTNLGTRINTNVSDLIFGGRGNSGSLDEVLEGALGDCFYLKDQVLSANEIRKIYAYGSRKFVTEDGNSKVAIHDGSKINGFYQKFITSTSAELGTNVSGTPVPDYQIHIPEDGLYRITCSIHPFIQGADSTDVRAMFYTRVVGSSTGTVPIAGMTGTAILWLKIAESIEIERKAETIMMQGVIYANKDDIINVEAWRDSSATATLNYGSGEREPYMMWEKLD